MFLEVWYYLVLQDRRRKGYNGKAMGDAMDWQVDRKGTDIVIKGPGGLEVVLRNFDPARVQRDPLLWGRRWSYPLDEEGTLLEVTSVVDPERGHEHRLHFGGGASWRIPMEMAAAIHVLGR